MSATTEQLGPAADRYVTAVNAQDLEGVVAAFAPDALLIDTSRQFRGADAIRDWAQAEVIGGRLEVLEVRPYDPGTQMIIRFTPPGSSSGFEACYTFDSDGDRITRANLQYECP
jgi:hypothetical protein